MQVVTKKEFYALIGPRDICVSSSVIRNESYFKTRSGVLVGICKRNDETEESTYEIDKSQLPSKIEDDEDDYAE